MEKSYRGAELWELSKKGYSIRDLVNLTGLDRKIVRDRIRNGELAELKAASRDGKLTLEPPAVEYPRPEFKKPEVTIDDGNFIVISDFEMPQHSLEYFRLVMATAISHNIKKLIIAGDAAALDMDGISKWARAYAASYNMTGSELRAEMIRMLNWLYGQFDWIWYMTGNHDRRVALATNGHFHLGQWFEHYDPARFTFSQYPVLKVHHPRGLVYVGHQDNYARVPLTVGQGLYNNHYPKGDIVVTHCHIRQSGWTSDGAHEIHAIGTGRQQNLVEYKNLRWNTMPQWNASFLLVKDGYYHNLDLQATDWRLFLKEEYYARIFR